MTLFPKLIHSNRYYNNNVLKIFFYPSYCCTSFQIIRIKGYEREKNFLRMSCNNRSIQEIEFE